MSKLRDTATGDLLSGLRRSSTSAEALAQGATLLWKESSLMPRRAMPTSIPPDSDVFCAGLNEAKGLSNLSAPAYAVRYPRIASVSRLLSLSEVSTHQRRTSLQFKLGEFTLRQCGKIEHHKFRSFCWRCRNLSGLTMISTS